MKNKVYSLRDFASNEDCSLIERAELFNKHFFPQFEEEKLMNAWAQSIGKIDTEMVVIDKYTGEERNVISYVSNNYLGYIANTKKL